MKYHTDSVEVIEESNEFLIDVAIVDVERSQTRRIGTDVRLEKLSPIMKI
jgi:hypothetical protein